MYFKLILVKRCFVVFVLQIIFLTNGETEDGKMRAVVLNRFGDPELLHIEEVPIPKISRDQILVKVRAAAINPVDAYIRAARYPLLPVLPAILGKEISGVVEKINATNTTFTLGQSVFCGVEDGGYAEYAAANISTCYPLGEHLSFAEGASIYIVYLATHRALISRANIQIKDTILVHGDNVHIANAAVQVAKSVGSYVVAYVSERAVVELNKRSQADYVLYRGLPDVLDPILEKLGKDGFDVILESSTKANITKDRFYLSPNGCLLVMGNRNITKGGRIYGTNVIPISFYKYTREEEIAASKFFVDGIQNRWISPVVAETYVLNDAGGAHKDILSPKATRGKLIFVL